jgi:pimeloyl-ACP methyl ester carboxylesterase
MIAVLLALALLVAAALLATLAAALHSALGLSAAAGFAAGAAIVFLACPVGLTALACALALRWRARASPRLGAADFLRLAAGETSAFLRIFLLGQVLQPWLAPRDPARIEPGVTPVLFVHGIYCNAGVWHRLLDALRGAGTRNLFCLNLTPPLAGIDRFAAQLAQRVEEVCKACGTQKVIVVAHSMGGLVARAWLARLGDRSRLARLVTIGSPHRGSRLARLVPGRCAAEMVPGSEWLVRLSAAEAGAAAIPAICIFSWHDSLVAPQDSARLEGAHAAGLERLGHLQLLLEPAVHRRVAAEIAAARSGSPS